jgi:hypothetical protein
MSNTDLEVVKEINETRASVSDRFNDVWEDAVENAKFYRMVQYTDKQLNKAVEQNRIPYTFDYITAPMNTFVGLQRDTRRDIIYLPFEKNDEVRVELCNMVKDSIIRNNNFLYTESDIFQDGLIEKTGVIGYEWTDEKNPLGELKMFRVPQRQMCWDLNNRDSDIDKGAWCSRLRLFSKGELINRYPDYKKEINNMSIESFIDDLGLDSSYTDNLLDSKLGSIAEIEFYKRDFKIRYFIHGDDNVLDEVFEKEKDAVKHIKNLLQQYEQQIVPQAVQAGVMLPPPPQYRIKAKSYPVIHKSVCAGSIVFEDEDTDLPGYPYDKYHPFFHDGKYWGLLDLVKDPQKFINRTAAMVDHQMMSSSKGLLVLGDGLSKAMAKKITDNWNKTGGVVTGVPNPDINVKWFPPSGFDQRVFSFIEYAITNIDRKVGGANFQGRQESSNESGTLFNQRVNQGSLQSFVMYDNLTRFKKSVGEKILFYISNYMTTPQKIRIEGEELTNMARQQFPQWLEESSRQNVGYLTTNTHPSNTLEGLKADVIVEETKHSVTKNQMIMQQITPLINSSPVLAETISPLMIIDLLDAPSSTKQEWKKQVQQGMEQRAQAEQNKNQKPPSLSASLSDISVLPPEAQAQFAQLFGLQLGQPLPDKEAIKMEIDKNVKDADMALKLKKHVDGMNFKEMKAMLDVESKKWEILNTPKEKKDAVQK